MPNYYFTSFKSFSKSPQNDKYFPNTNERPCYIEGTPEDIVKAIKTIQEKLANDNPRRGKVEFRLFPYNFKLLPLYVLPKAKLLLLINWGGGGGVQQQKRSCRRENPRWPLSFLLFFVLFQNTFKVDVFVPNLVENVSSKKNKKDHDFCLF